MLVHVKNKKDTIIETTALEVIPPEETAALDVLTPEEKKTLTKCEKILEKGFQHYLPMGEALEVIRKQRLYRIDFKDFQSYCQSRWQLTRQYVNRLIAAGETEREIKSKLETTVSCEIVKTENQAQRYRKLDQNQKEKLIEVLKFDMSKNAPPNLARALADIEPKRSTERPDLMERLATLSGQVCVILGKIQDDERETACETMEQIATWFLKYSKPIPAQKLTADQVMEVEVEMETAA
jgi:hypothetical protein